MSASPYVNDIFLLYYVFVFFVQSDPGVPAARNFPKKYGCFFDSVVSNSICPPLSFLFLVYIPGLNMSAFECIRHTEGSHGNQSLMETVVGKWLSMVTNEHETVCSR